MYPPVEVVPKNWTTDLAIKSAVHGGGCDGSEAEGLRAAVQGGGGAGGGRQAASGPRTPRRPPVVLLHHRRELRQRRHDDIRFICEPTEVVRLRTAGQDQHCVI